MKFFATLILGLVVLPLGAQPEPVPPPIPLEQLLDVLRYIKTVGAEQIVDMIDKRGVDFRYSDSTRRSLEKAGATEAVLRAVSRASERRASRLRQQPLITPPQTFEEPQIELPPPLSPREQEELLARAREQALSYTKGLPSFICLQVTKRHIDPSGQGQWQLADQFNAKLSYEKEKGERYEIISVNNQMREVPNLEALGGSTSSGEFGTLLLALFEPERQARFSWSKQAALRGRATEVYDFSVDQEHSTWHVSYQKTLNIIPAYRGKVWVDRETGQTLRLAMVAVDIPKDFPIRIVESTLDYDWATISGIRFLLPAKAYMQMAESRFVAKNEITFRLYRKFSTDTSIKFDIPEEEPEKKPAPPPKKQ